MKNAYHITEGALFLAIYAVLLFLSIYVPVLGVVIALFMVLPFIVITYRNDLKFACIFFISAIVLSLIVGTVLAIPLTITNGMVGIVVGYSLKKQQSRLAIYIMGSLTMLVNIVGQYIIAVLFFQIDFINELIAMTEESLQMSVQMMETFGQQPNEKLLQQFEQSIIMIRTIAPSMFVIISFLSMFFIQLVNLPILKRFKIEFPKAIPFHEMSLPKSILWYYLITLLFTLVMKQEDGQFLFMAITNLILILQLLFVLQGLMFIFYYCHEKKFAKSIPIIGTVVVFMIPFLLQIVKILGIIDVGFHLRKYVRTSNH